MGKQAFSNLMFIKLYIRKQKSRKHWHDRASLLPLGLVHNVLKFMCWSGCQMGSCVMEQPRERHSNSGCTSSSVGPLCAAENIQAELCTWCLQHPQTQGSCSKLLHLAELKKLKKVNNGGNQTYKMF